MRRGRVADTVQAYRGKTASMRVLPPEAAEQAIPAGAVAGLVPATGVVPLGGSREAAQGGLFFAGRTVPTHSPKPMRAAPGFSHQPRKMMASPSSTQVRTSPLGR